MARSKTSSQGVVRGLEVERVEVASLVKDPANVRRHSEKNLEAIKGSLARFGQQKPIVVGADGVVIAGNGTLAAAQSPGWSMIDIVRSPLTGSEATAYAIADNRTAELAEWDDEALAQQLAALSIEDQSLAASTGYSVSEIEQMTGSFDVEDIDAPSLQNGDREPFRQMAFNLHDDQATIVEAAIKKAKAAGGGSSHLNENSNGNALSYICERFTNE